MWHGTKIALKNVTATLEMWLNVLYPVYIGKLR